MKTDLSVIIVSYNTKELTLRCISQLLRVLSKCACTWEVVVIDNDSQDGSSIELQRIHSDKLKIICNTTNKGYGKANNQGLGISVGRYVLYLNSDVLIPDDLSFDSLVSNMDAQPLCGALTVRVELASGQIDPASHRGFPTVWRSFCYYAGLERLTKNIPHINKMFGGYHLTSLSLSTKHEIDSPTGAFFLARKDVLDILGGFDERFFMYGEDLDLSYRIKRLGYLVLYDPTYTVLHLKYQSGMGKKGNTETQKKARQYFYDAMGVFYEKHYEKKYHPLISKLVRSVINLKKSSI